MKILLVEDSPSDRDILRHLLDAKFNGEVEFHEASTLQAAFDTLKATAIDCVVLDLQLPDSVGKETFRKLNHRFPSVPFIVMTHSKDRDLAVQMIQEGAADFVIKSYGNEEEIFRRVTFAVEKHRTSVRVKPDAARSYHNLAKAKVNLEEAQERDETPSTIRNISVEVMTAVADLSSKIFTELQGTNLQIAQLIAQYESIAKKVDILDKEILQGHPTRPSMRSQMDLMDHRVSGLEKNVKDIEEEVDEVDHTQRRDALDMQKTKMSLATKIVIAIITLLGITITALGTYYAAASKDKASAPKAASSASK